MTVCTLEQHRAETRALLDPLFAGLAAQTEELPLGEPDPTGRVISRRLTARTPVPGFDNSQMDGYAVRAADLADATAGHPVTLPLGRATAAGDAPLRHEPGTASPIMTGAPVPEGADAVVPVEETHPPRFPRLHRRGDPPPSGDAGFGAPVAAGRFIRRRAEDIEVGATVAEPGTRITPSLIGALAATGIDRVAVRPRPRILLCSTGDELTDPDDALRPGLIHDANTPMLRAALRCLGAAVRVLRTGDTEETLREAVLGALGATDLVVTTGGISMGAFEVVRGALAPLGIGFHSIAMQPGGPQGLGLLRDGERAVPVLCFPGNPVSAALSCELFLAPALRGYAGLRPEPETVFLPLAHDVESPPAKHQIRRGALDAGGRVAVSGPGSHLIGELAAAELLVHLPIGIAHADAGSLVETWRFND